MAIRITQAGMALTVGIITVTLLIIGGFLIVKNIGEQARRDEAINIANQNREQQSNEDVALNDGDPAENEGAEDESAPAEESAGNTDTSAEEAARRDAAEAAELPQTGPIDSLSSVVVLSALIFSVVSYVTSRRQL